MEYYREDPKLEKLPWDSKNKDGKKQKKWLREVITSSQRAASSESESESERQRVTPAAVVAAAAAVEAPAGAALLPAVTFVAAKTKLKMLRVDGKKKHERYFSVDASKKLIQWGASAGPSADGKHDGKTERLISVTGAITAISAMKPKYADRSFTIGTEELETSKRNQLLLGKYTRNPHHNLFPGTPLTDRL